MARFVSDCFRIMRLALGRRNENDPDSSDGTMLSYLRDFMSLTMTDDIKIFEQFGTLEFTIDSTVADGVYTFNDVGASQNFSNISPEGFITLSAPPTSSISWNLLEVFQDPVTFYDEWGVNNYSILIPGYPTQMLYYSDQMVFRTIPDTSYDVILYGYKILADLEDTEEDQAIGQDYWLRYLAYGAAVNYARDYRFSEESLSMLERNFAKERAHVMARTHNQRKVSRCMPRF